MPRQRCCNADRDCEPAGDGTTRTTFFVDRLVLEREEPPATLIVTVRAADSILDGRPDDRAASRSIRAWSRRRCYQADAIAIVI